MEIHGTNSQLSAGLRVWLSQKGIQREKPASKYKLQCLLLILLLLLLLILFSLFFLGKEVRER